MNTMLEVVYVHSITLEYFWLKFTILQIVHILCLLLPLTAEFCFSSAFLSYLWSFPAPR